MTPPPTDQIVIPSARRLMESLRDIGYDTPAAVADLVDNSIDADARNIDVTVAAEGAESWVRIADDGAGMSAGRLDEAMRYGSSRTYGDEDLGAFGLGLKTASLSQCRRLTVATRTSVGGKIEIRRWDLDRVARRDAWELQRLTPGRCAPHLIEPLRQKSGTVVLWERLDRVLDYARPDGQMAMKRLEGVTGEVGDHLAMVFHRFLSGELRRGRARIAITINGDWLEAWDPFARDEPATRELPRQQLSFKDGGRSHRVGVRAYILPNQVQFSSPEVHARAGGPKRWNRQQGLYIYRRDRLIQSGGWNRLRTADEHSKLARIAVNIPPSGDGAFRTNVSKMNVILPAELRPALRTLASGVVAQAQDAYRQRMQLVKPETSPDSPELELTGGWRLGDDWGTLVEILESELRDQPVRLRRILARLAGVPADDDGDAAAGL
ncbi:MAG TPA: ATP-binding protein [Solirubrobacterales bacterium]|nr:ATP-binding protein [Solirubrobacterales bacterium]